MHLNTDTHLGPLGPCKCMHKREAQGVKGLPEDTQRSTIFSNRASGVYYIAATIGLLAAGLYELAKEKKRSRK